LPAPFTQPPATTSCSGRILTLSQRSVRRPGTYREWRSLAMIPSRPRARAASKADVLRVASRRRDCSLQRPVTIWVVRHGDDLYVRSVNGRSAAWFRGTQVRHEGRISAGGVDRDVTLEEVDRDLDEIDAAYRTSLRTLTGTRGGTDGRGPAVPPRPGADARRPRGEHTAEELPGELVYAGFSFGEMIAQKLAQTRPGASGALLFYSCSPISGECAFGPWPADVPVQIHGMDADPIFAGSSLPSYDAGATALLTRRVLEFLARV